MKKILLTICFSPLILGAVELHPQEDCESVKSNLESSLDALSFVSTLYDYDIYYAFAAYTNINDSIADFRQKSRYSAYSQEVRDAYYYCGTYPSLVLGLGQVGLTVRDLQSHQDYVTNQVASLSNIVSSIDCTQCALSSTNCCDFTEIINAINNVNSSVQSNGRDISQILLNINRWLPQIEEYIEVVGNNINSGFLGVTNLMLSVNDCITNLIYGLDGLVSTGFENTTNLLQSIYDVDSSGWAVATNYLGMLYYPQYTDDWLFHYPEMLTKLSYPSYINGHFDRFYSDLSYFNNDIWGYGVYLYGLTPTIYLMLQEILGGIYSQNGWTQYNHEFMYPPITNILISTYIQQTNYFSFFRGELGVQGVLSDWTLQEGSYYDFLTNHYLSIMRGDTLPPSLATKTNWFSRIETLLAALVFPDSQTTNVVDSSAYSQQQQALQSAISSVNNSASSSFSSFSTSANSIVSLFQSYVQTFDDVALPSRFVLFTLSNVDGDSDVVSFSMSENPALNLFVEGCRAVTTFCWASVGIFCLFRFMVWACRGIFYACVFLYKAISAVLH